MTDLTTDILVIGGGPAGLAAAEAASSHVKQVTVIDENPHFGGQIWRAEKRTISSRAGRSVDALAQNGVKMIPSCTCVASLPGNRILAVSKGSAFKISFRTAIIATGARERFIPFPGWTLPGVFGAGGLQALVKAGYDISGKRIVVAGTGPLLVAVAAYLKSKGGNVLLIAEQAGPWRLFRLGLHALRVPGKLSEGLELRRRIRGIPYKTASLVTRASGENKLEGITLRNRGKEKDLECDILAAGYHLTPNTEVAEAFDCGVENGSVITGEWRQTTVPDVLCAGEPTQIAGLEQSILEGKMAGLVAAGKPDHAKTFAKEWRRNFEFANRMNSTFRADSGELRKLQTDDTIVCRCEDVAFGQVKAFETFNDAKLQTRLGMGFCQGRVCGPACQALFGWEELNRVRPPISPVKISELANLEMEKT